MRKFILSPILLFGYYVVNAQNDSVPNALKLSELSLETLMDINVITATGTQQKISEAPSTMNVITAKQIEERGYEQLEDALRDIPGIDFIHVNGYAPTLIYFRGMYGSENLRALLMIDGIPENNIVGSNNIAGPAYSLHNVQRIEVVWGPASALYGANAFGGVINIITKKGEDIKGLHYEKGYGTFNTSFDKVMFGIKKSNWNVALSGSLYSTDGPTFTNRDPNYSGSYVDKAYSFQSTISYSTEKLKTTFGFRTYHTPMGWGTLLNSPTKYLGLPSQGNGNVGVVGLLSSDIRGEKSGLEDTYSTTTYIQNEFIPNKKFSLLTRVIYRETGIADDSYLYITLDGRKLIRAPMQEHSNRAKAEAFANYSPDDKQQFSAGIQYYRDDVERGNRGLNLDSTIYLIDGRDSLFGVNSTFKARQRDIRNNFGSYLQYVLNTNLLGKTSVTIGARYDYNNYYGSPISPRLAIINKPDDKLTVKLLFGTAYRAPTSTEIYQAPLNFKLTTEKIRTYEVNLLYPFSTKVFGQLNLFRNELRDVILLGLLSNTFIQDKNPGRINTNGLEARADVLLSKNISGFANFTYQKGTSENTISHIKRSTPGIAKVKGNAGIEFHIDQLLNVSLIENWVGKRRVPIQDPYGPVEGYFVTNCVISTKKLFNDRVSASLNIRNLFNATYLDPGVRFADGFVFSSVLEQPQRNMLFKVIVELF